MSSHDVRGAVAESTFQSILFDVGESGADGAAEPEFFADLRLDQVVASLTAGREQYDVAGFFDRPVSGNSINRILKPS